MPHLPDHPKHFGPLTLYEKVNPLNLASLTQKELDPGQRALYVSMLGNLDDKGFNKVIYTQVNGEVGGRLYARNASLQGFSKLARHIASEPSYDFDLKNAHPTLLVNLCKGYGIPCPVLTDYVERRQSWLEEGEYMKLAVVKSLYGSQEETASEKVTKLRVELQAVTAAITPHYPTLSGALAKLKPTAGEQKLEQTLMSYILQGEEIAVIWDAMEFLKREFPHVDLQSYIYDGFMVRKAAGVDPAQMLDALNQHVRGGGLSFVIKPFECPVDFVPLKEEELTVGNLWWLLPFRRVHKKLSLAVGDAELRNLHVGVSDDSTTDLAQYLAAKFCSAYRYSHDTTEKDMVLYRKDGALFHKEQGPHNLSSESRGAMVTVLQALLEVKRWDPTEIAKLVKAGKEADKATQAAEKAKATGAQTAAKKAAQTTAKATVNAAKKAKEAAKEAVKNDKGAAKAATKKDKEAAKANAKGGGGAPTKASEAAERAAEDAAQAEAEAEQEVGGLGEPERADAQMAEAGGGEALVGDDDGDVAETKAEAAREAVDEPEAKKVKRTEVEPAEAEDGLAPKGEEEGAAEELMLVGRRDAAFSGALLARLGELRKTVPFGHLFKQLTERLKTNDFLKPRGIPMPHEFCERLDSSPYAIGFTNGVFMVDAESVEKFKFHRTSDTLPPHVLVSFSTGYEYRGTDDGGPVDAEDERKMAELEALIFDKTFTDPDTKKAVKLALACIPIGGSGLVKKLFLLVGPVGNNGKSILIKVLEETYGDYYSILPYSVLTTVKSDPDAPSPSLAGVVKAKVVVLPEGTNLALNEAFCKLHTGGDKIKIRDLYGKAKTVPFLPKLIAAANVVPKVASDDEAMHNRLYPIDFTSHFSSKYAQDNFELKQFRASDFDGMVAHFKANRHILMLLALKYCKDFVAGTTSGTPLKLLPVAANCEAAALLKEGSLSERVCDWLHENYDATDGEFNRKKKSETQLRCTMMNFEDVWRAFHTWALKEDAEMARTTDKATLEKILRKGGVLGWKPVSNEWVKGVRKAVRLWPKAPSYVRDMLDEDGGEGVMQE